MATGKYWISANLLYASTVIYQSTDEANCQNLRSKCWYQLKFPYIGVRIFNTRLILPMSLTKAFML